MASAPEFIPNYIEVKATDLASSKSFYESAFGFKFTDYGTDYAAVEGGLIQIGVAAGDAPTAPMPIFETNNLEAALEKVKEANGQIVRDIIAYPGGRRFEFLDPSGNRLGVYQND